MISFFLIKIYLGLTAVSGVVKLVFVSDLEVFLDLISLALRVFCVHANGWTLDLKLAA